MTKSSSLRIEPRRRAYVRLMSDIYHTLNQAVQEEHAVRGLTRSGIAKVLGVNKSVISRRLAGSGNMTLETLADLAYALNRPVKVTMPSRVLASGSNQLITQPAAEAATGNAVWSTSPTSSTSIIATAT